MPRNSTSVRVATALAGVFLAFPALPAHGQDGACPPNRPVVTGPSVVNKYEGYSISWTNVLSDRPVGPADIFVVERSTDPAFGTGVERYQTARTSATWRPPGGAPRTIHHRVIVQSYCGGSSAVRVESAPLAVQITDKCSPTVALPAPTVSPEAPPAFTTYVVSWDTLGSGEPGPGGGAEGLRFRLRRTSASEVTETLNDSGAVAFADGPGEYLYQVRTENICGEAGAWSDTTRVVVGATKTVSVVVVSQPKAIVFPAMGGSAPSVAFTVRNAGSDPVELRANSPDGALSPSVASFALQAGESRRVSAVVTRALDPDAPLHTELRLEGVGVSLRVPVDAGVAAADAELPVGWDDEGADLDRNASALTRVLVNPGARSASIVSSISAEWLTVSSLDGKTWDRPLAAGESRPVRITVDRSKRRAGIGTEVATVTVVTAGHAASPKSLSVVDDGPVVVTGGPSTGSDDLPPLYLMKSRLLFPSLPNVVDARGVGRYTSDLWLSNVDALSAIKVLLTLTPAGQGNTSAGVRKFVFSLGPGETRRFRNIIGTLFDYVGACSLDVSSPAATLSATAMVNNKPIVPLVAGRTAALGTAVEGTVLSTAEFGFEMRPVAPGEGATALDPTYVVSGLWHDGRRRTNLILRETTGNVTTVRIQVFDQAGNAVLRAGGEIDFEITVPALGSLQVNDTELFPEAPIDGSLWARVEFRSGVVDPFGRVRGAVVPFATVIDSGTQDASLRVGVSKSALAPVEPETPAFRALSSSLPFEGEAEPLLFPVAHVTGAALSSGRNPRWRTRVTLSNVGESEQRNVRLRFVDKSGRLPEGTLEQTSVVVPPGWGITFDDVLEDLFGIPADAGVWGTIEADNQKRSDGTWLFTWTDVDVQTETYTADTENPSLGEFRTGMEAYSYQHGYSSFQSNLGTALIDGAETSPRNRTNLILEEVGGASCTVAVGVYPPGSLVPLAIKFVSLKPFDYVSRELFRDLMELDLEEVVDARVVVRQMEGDGVFMAFVSKINLVTGDPANVFLRPASAGTGR